MSERLRALSVEFRESQDCPDIKIQGNEKHDEQCTNLTRTERIMDCGSAEQDLFLFDLSAYLLTFVPDQIAFTFFMYHYYLHIRTYLILKKKQLLNALSFAKNTTYIPFVILCEPRSGSTLLHTYLNFHPQIQSYGEILRETWEVKKDAHADPLENSIRKPHAPKIKAVGLKLFYFYYEHALYAGAFQEILKNHDIKIIHLIRKDILKLYISLQRAEKTNVWSSTKAPVREAVEKITINIEDFRYFATTYVQRQKTFQNLFQNHPIHNITYEDLSSNPDDVLKGVQKFLGVSIKKLQSLLQKQNAENMEGLLINYEEAKAVENEMNLRQ